MIEDKDNRQSLLPDRPFTRRTLLDWLGKATVLAICGDLLSACGSESDNGRIPLSENDTVESEFAFAPGSEDQSIYGNWAERTVDEQDLIQILQGWQLGVDGLVETPQQFSFAQLLEMERHDQVTDFHCVEGWSVWDVPWNGIHLDNLFQLVGPLPEATHVTFHTIGDKYNESLPLAVAREPKTLLAYGVDQSTLSLKHGFPLRLVVPRLFGYKNAKYIYRIELAAEPVKGFWVRYGYPYEGEVPDSALRPGKY